MSVGRSARRVLIVCAATAACGVSLGVGPASAASTTPSNNGGLLGLNTLVNGLTTGLSKTLSPNATTVHAGTTSQAATAAISTTPSGGSDPKSATVTAGAAPSSLGSVLEDLPVLGPVLTPVVHALPILGGNSSSPSSPAPTSSGSSSAASTPAAVHLLTPQAAVPGSTWTKRDGTTSDSGSGSTDGNTDDNGGILPSLPNPLNILPTTMTGKAEVGAAAVALIILGGVAVAGAAGAAGAAGRRQFVGGPW